MPSAAKTLPAFYFIKSARQLFLDKNNAKCEHVQKFLLKKQISIITNGENNCAA